MLSQPLIHVVLSACWVMVCKAGKSPRATPSLKTASFAFQKVANFAIYAQMVQYVLIWIFADHQSSILLFGMVFWALRIPYFVKTGERAIVNESLFLICADTLGVVTQSRAGQEALAECIAIFGK